MNKFAALVIACVVTLFVGCGGAPAAPGEAPLDRILGWAPPAPVVTTEADRWSAVVAQERAEEEAHIARMHSERAVSYDHDGSVMVYQGDLVIDFLPAMYGEEGKEFACRIRQDYIPDQVVREKSWGDLRARWYGSVTHRLRAEDVTCVTVDFRGLPDEEKREEMWVDVARIIDNLPIERAALISIRSVYK